MAGCRLKAGVGRGLVSMDTAQMMKEMYRQVMED
jgi:hypothetical protein